MWRPFENATYQIKSSNLNFLGVCEFISHSSLKFFLNFALKYYIYILKNETLNWTEKKVKRNKYKLSSKISNSYN